MMKNIFTRVISILLLLSFILAAQSCTPSSSVPTPPHDGTLKPSDLSGTSTPGETPDDGVVELTPPITPAPLPNGTDEPTKAPAPTAAVTPQPNGTGGPATTGGKVALTFDDGPSAAATAKILDLLERYQVKATFFVLGNMAEALPELLKRQVALGCEIGNHTQGHKYLTKLSVTDMRYQIDTVNNHVEAVTGVRPRLLRPPYGAKKDYVRAEAGMPLMLWNIDTEDWKHRNAQKTIDAVLNFVKDGDVILMHDLYATTAEACETIIPELINRGFELVTVSELFEAKGIALSAGKDYRMAK